MAVIEKTIALEGSKGSKEVSALFDSGATYSCINPRLAAELEVILPLPRPMEFGTAKACPERSRRNGETLRATERVSLDFYLKGYRFSDEFVLIPDLSEEVIIGAKTLQAWRLKLDFEADDVIIDPRVTKPEVNLTGSNSTTPDKKILL